MTVHTGHGRAIGFNLIAMALFAIVDTAVKYLTGKGYPVGELVFFRALFGCIPVFILVYRMGGLRMLRTRRPMAHVLRAVIGIGSMALFFVSFREMPFADVVSISFTAPLFVTVLSVPMLREKLDPARSVAVVTGFLGVLLIVQPGPGLASEPWALVALVASFLYAFAVILIRRLGATEQSITIVMIYSLCCVVLGALSLLIAWKTPEGWGDLLVLIAMGLSGGTAQYCMTHAYRLAPASVVAPFDYSTLLWAALVGYLIFAEVPGWGTLVGSLVIVASGLAILYREAGARGKSLPHEPTPA